MKGSPRTRSARSARSARSVSARSVRRVALVAAAVALVVYAVAGIVAYLVVLGRLSHEVNGRLADRLGDVRRAYEASGGKLSVVSAELPRGDLDDTPVVVWFVPDGAHRAVPLVANAPTLPAKALSVTRAVGGTIGSRPFRFAGEPVRGGRLVAATSTRSERFALTTLAAIELVLAPLVFAGVLGTAWLIGRRAADPVEQARRQQQAFVADASHELRTPLTVIEAEVGLALSKERGAASYRDALERVSGESRRLRSLVEELLWLSRLEAAPLAPRDRDEPVDLAVIAEACVDRFRVVAEARGIDLLYAESPDAALEQAALLPAPAEWLAQLAGVLVDNACKYASDGGTVRVFVTSSGTTVGLAVEDSGTGIADAERERIFDRFYRGEQREHGSGLGLAIADAVVHATGGRWSVGRASLGGARFAVSWSLAESPRHASRRHGARRSATARRTRRSRS